jgi:hypothetical protein
MRKVVRVSSKKRRKKGSLSLVKGGYHLTAHPSIQSPYYIASYQMAKWAMTKAIAQRIVWPLQIATANRTSTR